MNQWKQPGKAYESKTPGEAGPHTSRNSTRSLKRVSERFSHGIWVLGKRMVIGFTLAPEPLYTVSRVTREWHALRMGIGNTKWNALIGGAGLLTGPKGKPATNIWSSTEPEHASRPGNTATWASSAGTDSASVILWLSQSLSSGNLEKYPQNLLIPYGWSLGRNKSSQETLRGTLAPLSASLSRRVEKSLLENICAFCFSLQVWSQEKVFNQSLTS